jgi:zinc transport system permease protein
MADSTSLSVLWEARELFRDALLCASLAGAVLGFLGVYVVLRRMAFVSAAVTQAAGLGLSLAYYAQIQLGLAVEPALGAIALSLLSTLALSYDPSKLRLPRETLLGLSFALCGGLTVLVSTRISQEAHDVEAVLLGSAVLVRPLDLQLVAATAGVVTLVHLAALRGLVFATVDPEGARVQGLPVRLLSGVVLVSVGLCVGAAARALGALPVFAFSTLPATAALLIGASLPWTFALATSLGLLAATGGYVVAFLLDLPVGATQTVVAALLPCAVLLGRAAGALRPGSVAG